MPRTPQFSYYLSRLGNQISEDHPTWNKPLPLTRKHWVAVLEKNDVDFITIGDYFQAARAFLEKSGMDMIASVFRKRFRQNILSDDIERISIVLVKHGEFYHPARIEARTHDKQMLFVLNVAISRTGQGHIRSEYDFLKSLNRDFSLTYLPQVYGLDEVNIRDMHTAAMFLGQWFDDYYEFHISRDPLDKKKKIIVWDARRGNYFLSAGQSLDLYTRAAGILTSYYNLESFEQINGWHHAAGDFIVHLENQKLDLKLITVRRYASKFKNSDNHQITERDPELILQAMLVFFLTLSIKMRLDRLDGVGDIVWADKSAVQGTLVGFLNALGEKANVPSLPDSALRCFFYYLSGCSKSDLHELSEAILTTFNTNAPEYDVIKQHHNSHIDTLHRCIHQL